jgi:osmotically-inducible protein OsmY
MRRLTKTIGLVTVLCWSGAFAADQPAGAAPPAAAPQTRDADNTAINKRDKGNATQTPQKQTNREPDRKLVASVRRALVRDKSLSTSAHNVKIVTRDGVVTLRGPVRSDEEKGKVEQLAQAVAGVKSVDNKLDVKQK